MDTRESKTPEEELEHLKGVRQPEDFEHPEPDAEQPEAKSSPQGMQRVLYIVIAVIGIAAAALLYLGSGAN